MNTSSNNPYLLSIAIAIQHINVLLTRMQEDVTGLDDTWPHSKSAPTAPPPPPVQLPIAGIPANPPRHRTSKGFTVHEIASHLEDGPLTIQQIIDKGSTQDRQLTKSIVASALYRMEQNKQVARVGGGMYGLLKKLPAPAALAKAEPPALSGFRFGHLTTEDVLEILPKDRPFKVGTVRRLLFKAGFGDRTSGCVSAHFRGLRKAGKIIDVGHKNYTLTPSTGVFSNGVKS